MTQPHHKPISQMVAILTIAGMVPFLLTTFAALNPEGLAILLKRDVEGVPTAELYARMSALGYAACILSFMAGVRWGGELEKPAQHINPAIMLGAVMPAIIAWIGMVLGILARHWMSGAMFFFAGCFLMLLAWDAYVGYPRWYYRLRIAASLTAVGCLITLGLTGLY